MLYTIICETFTFVLTYWILIQVYCLYICLLPSIFQNENRASFSEFISSTQQYEWSRFKGNVYIAHLITNSYIKVKVKTEWVQHTKSFTINHQQEHPLRVSIPSKMCHVKGFAHWYRWLSRQEEHLGNQETVTYYHQNRDNLRISIMCYTSQVAPCKKLTMSFQL